MPEKKTPNGFALLAAGGESSSETGTAQSSEKSPKNAVRTSRPVHALLGGSELYQYSEGSKSRNPLGYIDS